MNQKAFYKITYGLYIVCTGDKNKGNGYISNTFFQVTSSPAQFAVCCNKDNYTAGLIEQYGRFSVSVLQLNTPSEIFGRFGYKSGKDFDKLEGMNVKYGIDGTPIILNDCLAYFELKVVQKTDAGSHWLFIGELLDAEIQDDINEPITYSYYREVKKGESPKNAPTYIETSQSGPAQTEETYSRYECGDCGYIYDEKKEGRKFSDLPADWRCPVCGAAKIEFIEF